MESGFSASNPRRLPIAYMIARTAKSISPFTNLALHRAICGKLGRLDPGTGKSDLIALEPGAAPHGVIVGPDDAAWVTEGEQNAIARVDPVTRVLKLFPKSGATPT